MLPTGRRRAGTLSSMTTCLALLFLLASTASAAVLGIDFGTQNLKAALVKPGIPLDIVLTKDSKRKEVAAVAFKPNRDDKNNIVAELGVFPERAYGGDALALQGRIPGEVFPNLKLLLGLQWGIEANKTAGIYLDRYPGVRMSQEKDLGTTVFGSSAFVDEVIPFSVEELIGMQLANIKRNAESMAGGALVEDAVITIPAFYTADEKVAIVKAAGFAGLSVSSLISDGLAVGLDYAKTRTFPEVTKGEKPEYHMVFDMGAGSTTATLMRFQSRSVKDVGRFNKTIQEVTVLGTGWDRMLGGDTLNHVIMEDFLDELMKKHTLKSRGTSREEIKSNGRAMARFFKEAERVRQVLSANSDTSTHFEEILPDIDLRTKLSRRQFETLVIEFADRVDRPIKSALAMAKMSMADVDSVILHGGAVRTPFVQKKLEEVVGDSAKLRSNVNADESAVFGAAFKAASLSPSFKVKEIWNTDIPGYATGLMYLDDEKERKKPLFGANAAAGQGSTTKSVTFKDKEDFAFGLVQNVDGYDRAIRRVQTENLTISVDELVRRFSCDKQDIKTQFSIRLSSISGLPEVLGGTVSCEVDENAKTGSVGDTVKDWFGFGKKKDQEPLGEEQEHDGPTEEVEAAESTTSSAEAESATTLTDTASASSSAEPEPPKKRLESIPIRFSSTSEGNPQPELEELVRMKDRLDAFDESDRNRYAREEAQNVLEAYTYSVRDLLENSDYEPFSTSAQRDEISKTLQNTRQWMESSGEIFKATKETLTSKHKALKDLVEPIKARRKEGDSRPEMVKKLRNSLDQVQKMMGRVQETIDSINEAVRSEMAQSSSTTTPEAGSSTPVAAPADDLADLEEPDASSSTSTTEASSFASAKPSVPDYMNLSDITASYEAVLAWLTEKEAEQEKLQSHEEPVLHIKDLEAKAVELNQAMKDLINTRLKAERSSNSSTKKAKSSKTKKTSSPSTASVGDEDAAEETSGPSDESSTKSNDKPNAKTKITGQESLEDMMQRIREGGPGQKRDEL